MGGISLIVSSPNSVVCLPHSNDRSGVTCLNGFGGFVDGIQRGKVDVSLLLTLEHANPGS